MKTPWQVKISHRRINKKVLASCSQAWINAKFPGNPFFELNIFRGLKWRL